MSDNSKTLFIHIGTGKTGTSALQKYLVKNNGLLKEKLNLHYISTGLENNKHRALDLNSRRWDNKGKEKVENLFSLVNKEILSSSLNRFLISDEDFPGLSLDEIYFYRDVVSSSIKIKVIVYLRRQDEYLESWFHQVVKTGQYNLQINKLKDEISSKKILDYNELLMRWEKVFGRDNIIVRIYDKGKFVGGNIFEDFMSIFDIDSKLLDLVSGDVNSSITRDKALLLRKLSNNGFDEVLEPQFIDYLKKIPPSVGDSKYTLPPEVRRDFLQEFHFSNLEVSRRYFNNEEIFDSDISDDWRPRLAVPDELFIKVISYMLKRDNKSINNLPKDMLTYD